MNGVLGPELVAERGAVLLQLLEATQGVDELLLPLVGRLEARVTGHRGLAVVGEVRRVELGREVGDRGLVEVVVRHEPELGVGVTVALRQLDGIGVELGEGLGRRGDAGLREHRLVVVEAVGVAEERQRALVSLVLRVVELCLGERRRRVDAGLLEERREVDEGVRAAELADVVGRERRHHVRGLGPTRTQRLVDLVVGDVADCLDGDVGVDLLEGSDVVLDRLDLVGCAPAVPEGDGRLGVRVVVRAAARAPARRRAEDEDGGGRRSRQVAVVS